MLPRLLTLTLAAALVTIPCAALANDGGQDAGDAGTAGDAGAEASSQDAAPVQDGASVEDSGEESGGDSGGDSTAPSTGPVPVVACDGDLCDTQQGRPSCDVGGASGRAPVDSGVLVALSVALALAVARRSRRGASRPGGGGRAC